MLYVKPFADARKRQLALGLGLSGIGDVGSVFWNKFAKAYVNSGASAPPGVTETVYQTAVLNAAVEAFRGDMGDIAAQFATPDQITSYLDIGKSLIAQVPVPSYGAVQYLPWSEVPWSKISFGAIPWDALSQSAVFSWQGVRAALQNAPPKNNGSGAKAGGPSYAQMASTPNPEYWASIPWTKIEWNTVPWNWIPWDKLGPVSPSITTSDFAALSGVSQGNQQPGGPGTFCPAPNVLVNGVCMKPGVSPPPQPFPCPTGFIRVSPNGPCFPAISLPPPPPPAPSICADGFHYEPGINQCVPDNPPPHIGPCNPPYSIDPKTGQCGIVIVPRNCGPGNHWDGLKCVADYGTPAPPPPGTGGTTPGAVSSGGGLVAGVVLVGAAVALAVAATRGVSNRRGKR